MPFEKNKSGNPNGRPAGSKNKVGNDLRERIAEFLSEEFENIKKDYKELDAKAKAKFYNELLQYGIPKMQAMQLETDFDKLTDAQLDEIIERLKTGSNPGIT